ncbi:hypothetical protein K431DRAFT_303536 [Polychaeton citri CBS 116435]|uniref:BZIP domain-containing protein n=1 Tax=Polychaeton citri CBS 116435 TaxID=1314669 RepID=A0A9P4UQB3_9PEZI|nr:hypothetical protein K431DRAFT_303536 [Polychaeton citri CBS 116435]
MPGPADAFTTEAHISSDNETRSTGTVAGSRKRISKAGHRNISSLSATQLERKRANDREAQRAIRQRTKEHIENLERTNSDLRALHDADQRRIDELERENAYLRELHAEAGLPRRLLDAEAASLSDRNVLPVEAPSPAASVSRSDPGCSTTPQLSSLRQRAWHNNRIAGLATSHLDSLTSSPSIAPWRPQGSENGMTSAPRDMGSSNRNQSGSFFALAREQWATSVPFPRPSSESSTQHIPQEYYSLAIDQTSQQVQPGYCNSPSALSCTSETPSYQPDYDHHEQPPSQAAFQGMAHASHAPNQQMFQEMSPVQVQGLQAPGTGFTSPSEPIIPAQQLLYSPGPTDSLYQLRMAQTLAPFGDDSRSTPSTASYPHNPSI